MVTAMSLKITNPNKKTWYGAKIELDLFTKSGTYRFTNFHPKGYGVQITGEINGGDGGSPATNTISIYNLSKAHENLFKDKLHVVVKAGGYDLFGIVGAGNITKVAPVARDGEDRFISITFVAGKDYSKTKNIYSAYSGTTQVKHSYKTSKGQTITWTTSKKKNINIRFKKGVKAKTIIERISREADIPVAVLHLKKNKVYKHGYTLSKRPLAEMKAIAKDCDSRLWYRMDDVIIDYEEKPKTWDTHLYLTLKDGLVNMPTISDESGKKTAWTVVTYLNPMVANGSVFYVAENIKSLVRVKNYTHSLDDMQTTCEVEAV
ncbi:hypothetical protein FD37_GL002090 [Levilactobacillus spicheri DSM 15429]|uniref:Uncharacterized protein n=2 Tax=Levilactobacillus spicheri TaxID=216463 RepID=A0A0R1RB73_9LACO|nr:hypothetical protein FD37_GL002090 [Levilactobacillus spicheri DSM 15429]